MATKTPLAIKQHFLGSSHYAGYAVVGASKDTAKIGSQVLKWYVDRDLPVTPVHPKESELEYIKTLPNIGELPEPTRTPVHVITNPKVTLGILQKAKEIGTPALWLQPGAEDQAVIDFINNNGLADRVVYGGACVLKEGDPIREYLGYRRVAPEEIQVMQRHFLTSKSYAVVGASKERTKYGNRVLRWYQTREYDVIPVHPKEPELEGIKTINNIGELPSPTTTSIHIITPPKITLAVVQKAKELGCPAIWIQPGAEDDAVIKYVKENGLADHVIYGGPCILVQGDGLREQQKYQSVFNGRPHPNW